MELEQARRRGHGVSGQLAEKPRLLRFGTNLMPSWKKAFSRISVGQPGGLASWPSRHPPCQLLVAVCHLGHALNCMVSKVVFQRLPASAAPLLGGHRHLLTQTRIASPRQAQPRQHGLSEPQVCPRGRQRKSGVYLLSKVKSGLDRRREALSRKIPFRGEQRIHNLLKLSLVLHHLMSPAITLRRSRLQLAALSHRTRVPSLLWATCRKCLSGDNKRRHNAPEFPSKYSCGW